MIKTKEILKDLNNKETSKKGLQIGWERYSAIMRIDYIENIKALSWYERKDIKNIFDEALEPYLKKKRIKIEEAKKEILKRT